MDAISSARHSMQVPLPPEVLQLVLQHVDLPHRLGPCALVCRAWRAAANAATISIAYTALRPPQCVAALSDWLQQHGGQVEQLRGAGGKSTILALPCSKLTKLDTLDLCGVNARPINSVGCGGSAGVCSRGSSSGSPGLQQQPLAALTQLTQLRLVHVGWAGSLQPLSTLTSLRHLFLRNIECLGDDTFPTKGADGALDAAIGGAVSHLVQLTYLSLNYITDAPYSHSDISDASLAHISCLQQLMWLEIRRYGTLTPACLAALPQSLTRLQLEGLKDVLLSSSTTPALAQLTALQLLQLKVGWKLEPVLLSQMTQLTCLCLCHGTFEPAGSAGAAALLAAVARMTLLQHLELSVCLSDSHAPAAAYAALTASSHLRCLRLGIGPGSAIPLPGGALQHMFAARWQLSNLQELLLCAGFIQEEQQQQQVVVPDYWALRQQGFDQLLQCCPGLRNLQLRIDVVGAGHQPPIKLDGLLALTGLTQLDLYGLLVDEGGITTLAQLTGLHNMSICHTGVKYTALLQLTQLKQLGRLELRSTRAPLSFGGAHQSAAQRPVWQQLQELCISSCKECARLVVLQLQEAQEQLADARLQLAAQQAQQEAQLADARRQLAAQQAQHEAQLALLQQQLQ